MGVFLVFPSLVAPLSLLRPNEILTTGAVFEGLSSHLDDLQFLEPLLDEILYLSRVLDVLVPPKCVPRPTFRVLAEVVGLELVTRAKQLSVLFYLFGARRAP